ncbi:PKD domain-containing protein [Reichenbachiella versicolor]|uniref:PKD domain-containing protein n=1 Tax=Reichenbachiella versicolor TaxID=1821036 RepID=UPI000D6EA93A|nr:PKD domain-containing protein [Reichenbachiella versicolor]
MQRIKPDKQKEFINAKWLVVILLFMSSIVTAMPVADFTFDIVCEGTETTFTSTSTPGGAGALIIYSWDFGDGEGSNLQSPKHTYATAGDYTVTLTVVTSLGDNDQVQYIVNVKEIPDLNFTFTNALQCESTLFEFQNNSTGVDTQTWDFSDGNSTDEDPSHTFTSTGSKDVTLSATHANGCVTSLTHKIDVYPDPVVDFDVDNTCLGGSASFTNHTTITSGNLNYDWDFDDGDKSVETNPSHKYTTVGEYQVSLTATSEKGCSQSLTLTGVDELEVFEQPIANFSYTDVCFNTRADFTNTTTGISMSDLSFEWSYGNGKNETTQDASHLYDASGTYDVTLSVKSINGCTSMVEKVININPLPEPIFTVSDACLGEAITLVNTSTVESGSLDFEWDFGDSNGSTEVNSSHTYGLDNRYTIELTATSDFSCEKKLSKDVVIYPTTDGGTTSGAITLCQGDPTIRTVSVTGVVGNIIRWESSLTNAAPWTTINEKGNSISYSNLDATTYYRAIVKSGVCDEVASTVTTITVDKKTVAGNITGSISGKCKGANNGEIKLSGQIGTVVEWQVSEISSTAGFTSEAITDNEYIYNDLDENTYYRALIQNGVCSQELTSVATVEIAQPSQGGVLSGAASVCSGNNNGLMELNGEVGDILYWEISDNGLAPWSVINTQEDNLDYDDLLFTRYYRAVVKNGDCPLDESNPVVITVLDNTDAGHLEGVSEVCDGKNSGKITLTDFVGKVTKWEYNDNGTDWFDLGVIDQEYTFKDLTKTTTYRAYVQNGGCAEEVTPNFEVMVHPLPVVSFNNDEVCEGIATSFTNLSTVFPGKNEKFTWDLGNGSIRVIENPKFLFDGDGVYSVKLTVETDQGCINEATQSVIVNPVPEAGIYVENNCERDESIFTDNTILSSGKIDVYEWKFGDTNTANIADPIHTYADNGSYDVSLRVTTDKGCSHETTTKVEIYPRAEPIFEVDNVCFGKEAEFQNNSKIENGNLFFVWNYGDINTSLVENPVHTYAADGDYLVNLQVTTNHGCIDNVSKIVSVHPQPEVNFSTTSVCADAPMVFNNATISSAASIEYDWDFGDTKSSDEENPSHQYESFGNYKVTLVAETGEGCIGTHSEVVVIEPLPQINFSIDNVCFGKEISAINNTTISNGTISYFWDLGNSDSRDVRQFTYKYNAHGDFDVTLEATSDFGCVSQETKSITIYPLPEVDFEVEEVCDGLESVFDNTSSIPNGTIDNYIWDFGDQTNAIVESPTKQYLNAGLYEVALQATSNNGCIDGISKEYVVHELPIANFKIESVCSGTDVEIDDKSDSPDGTLRYAWTFGNGEEDVVPEPTIYYELPGDYEVKLKVTAGNGCQDSLAKIVHVYYTPDAYAGEDVTVSKGFPAQLKGEGGVFYSWSPVEFMDDSQSSQPSVAPLETTTYLLEIIDENGCSDFDEVTVNVENDHKVVPSNVMTPDGNGLNDAWIVGNIENFGQANVVVFDRWGKIVFQEQGYQNDWVGTAGNDILPDGTYYYTITFPDATKNYSGAITIMRNK